MTNYTFVISTVFLAAVLSACGDSSVGIDDTAPVTQEVIDPKFSVEIPDTTLVGVDKSAPTINKFPSLGLLPGKAYTLKFSAKAAEVDGKATLRVDLHPDTLPENTFLVGNLEESYEWSFSSSLPEVDGSVLRFFSFLPEGEEIVVTNIELTED